MLLDIYQILDDLSKKRPVFHNERDFQFALATEIQQQHPDYIVRLEYCYPQLQQGRRSYVDILVSNREECALLELKYKTRTPNPSPFTDAVTGETFNLQNHGAVDYGCHAVLSDLSRIEQQMGQTLSPYGTVIEVYSILLTNDPHYKNGISQGYWVNFGLKDRNKFFANNPIDFNLGGMDKESTCCANFNPITLLHDYPVNYKSYSAYLDMLVLQAP